MTTDLQDFIDRYVNSLPIADDFKSSIQEYLLSIDKEELLALLPILENEYKHNYLLFHAPYSNQGLLSIHLQDWKIQAGSSLFQPYIMISQHFKKLSEATGFQASKLNEFREQMFELKKHEGAYLKDVQDRIYGLDRKFEELNLAELGNRLYEIESRLNDINSKSELQDLKKKIEDLSIENQHIKEYLYEAASSYNSKSIKQNIPVDIYLDTDEPELIFKSYESILDFLDTIGFVRTVEFKAIKGSWIKKFIARSKTAMSSEEVTDRLKEAEYGIEVNAILKQQSEIDKNQSEALLNILKSVLWRCECTS